MACKFCLEDKKCVEAHIIPNSLYEPLLNDNRGMLIISNKPENYYKKEFQAYNSKRTAIEEATKRKSKQKIGIGSKLSPALPEIAAEFSQDNETEIALKSTSRSETKYRLAVIDVLRILQSLRQKANISAIYVFVDEFSSLSSELQGRFTTLLRKMLGTHAGVFIKLCAITYNYSLGSSIIL